MTEGSPQEEDNLISEAYDFDLGFGDDDGEEFVDSELVARQEAAKVESANLSYLHEYLDKPEIPSEIVDRIRNDLKADLERAQLREMKVQLEVPKWDALGKISENFNKLSDKLDRFTTKVKDQKTGNKEDTLFTVAMNYKTGREISRRDSTKLALTDGDTNVSVAANSMIVNSFKEMNWYVDDVIDSVESFTSLIGDDVVVILKLPLELLKKRSNAVQDDFAEFVAKPSEKAEKKFSNAVAQYQNYLSLFFSEFNNTLFSLDKDPYVRALMKNPFRVEVQEGLFAALKIPACPVGVLSEYIDQWDVTEPDFAGFDGHMDGYMDIEFDEQNETFITESIQSKQKEAEKKWNVWKNVVAPNKQEQRDVIEKEYNYWSNITVEGIIKELLQWRMFRELRRGSYTPEFMYKTFLAWQAYEKGAFKEKEQN